MRNFQKCLIQLAMQEGKDVLFMETAARLGGGRAHAALEAVFVEPQVRCVCKGGGGVVLSVCACTVCSGAALDTTSRSKYCLAPHNNKPPATTQIDTPQQTQQTTQHTHTRTTQHQTLLQAMARAPLYFKQALEHAESEWSQHHAKAVIDTGAKVWGRVEGCDVMERRMEQGCGEGFRELVGEQHQRHTRNASKHRPLSTLLLNTNAPPQHQHHTAPPLHLYPTTTTTTPPYRRASARACRPASPTSTSSSAMLKASHT